MVKRNALLQMSKWEIDRAALEALAQRSRDEAEVAVTVHESERADLSAYVEQLQATIQEMELERERLAKEAETAAEERCIIRRFVFARQGRGEGGGCLPSFTVVVVL